METASKLVELVQTQVRGCPEHVCGFAVRKAFARICKQTDCWREEVSFVVDEVTTNIKDNALIEVKSTGYDAGIARIFTLYVEKYDSDDLTFGDAAPVGSFLGLKLGGNTPSLIISSEDAVEVGDRVTVDMSLAPNEIGSALSDMPAGIVELCGKAVEQMALAILFAMSNRPWFDKYSASQSDFHANNEIRQIIFNTENQSTDGGSSSKLTGLVEG